MRIGRPWRIVASATRGGGGMRVLVACEWSGKVREAFAERGHDAISCDLEASALPGRHVVGDVRPLLQEAWDLVIAFPPCTRLASSGARWFKERRAEQADAIKFFMACSHARAPRIAVENPIGIMSTCFRKPDQIIQPWQFGHGEVKATCLWLFGLPKLRATDLVAGREPRVWRMGPGPARGRRRGETFAGIARAMAVQWG